MMELHLDVPAHARRLIKASAFPSVFKLYVVLVWFLCQCLLVVIYQTNMPVQNIFNDGQRIEKKPQTTESEDELPRLSPSEQEGLKHTFILVAVDAVPVLIRYAWKKRCFFKGCFFMTQLLKIRSCC